MRTLSTIATSAAGALTGISLFFLCAASPCNAGECGVAGKGFVSNYILGLAGQNDTLWMLSAKDNSLAFNAIQGTPALEKPDVENNWMMYSLDCIDVGVNELAYGGGYAMASLDTAPNVLWSYHHTTKKTNNVPLSWPSDGAMVFTVIDAVWSSGYFFCAVQNGGLLRWNPANNDMHVFFPGDSTGINQSTLSSSQFPFRDSIHRVTGVEVVTPDSTLMVTTPSRLYYFSITDASWDSSITSHLAASDVVLRGFNRVFVNTYDPSKPLYGILDVRIKKTGADTAQFYKYIRPSATWTMISGETPKSVSFTGNGYGYLLFDENRPGIEIANIMRIYRDTTGDSGSVSYGIPAVSENVLSRRMTKGYDIDIPDVFNDILYLPNSDSTGRLFVATSDGLFLSPNEKPGTDTSAFILIKRAPAVSEGLSTTYARPGIITPWSVGCTFIYNIKKSTARVTIKVYDYNMEHVRTIIENRTRQSGKNGGPLGRSTVESEDKWDGKNKLGRHCAPGIYYYKITTDSGERAFGKIVIAR